MSRLIDHFPGWATGTGIFHGMTGMPWNAVGSGISADVMDLEYFGMHSGLKQSSALIEKWTVFPNDHVLTAAEIASLQSIIKQKFNAQWQRIYDALLIEYAPLENYDMEEKTTPGAVKKTATETDATIANDSAGDVYGFNSASAVHATKAGGTSRTTGDKTKNYTEESYTGFNKLERHGNIGVTTSQQMLQAEIDIRQNKFLDIVYKDVDTILTRPSYMEVGEY